MKEYMVGFLVLLALVGLGVAKENPHGDKHSSEAESTDCSAYKGHQLRQCLQGRLVNTEEQKCDSAGNANCDCRGEGNACERSPGEDRSGEQHGHGGDDHGGHKGDNKGHHGKGNKGHGNRGDNGNGRGGDTSNKDDNDHKHNDGDKDREDNHNGSKGGRHNDDNDSHEGLRKHKGHHGSKEDRDGDDGGSHEGHEKHEGHHGSKEDRDGDDGGSHEGHEKHKGHHGSKEGRDGDDGGSHEGHEKQKGHHGSKEDRDGDDGGSHEGHEKHKGHHGSNEDRDGDDGGSHEGHEKHKGHHGSKEDRDGDNEGSHERHEKHKGHHGSKEDSGEDDGGSHEGHEKHKGHHDSKEDRDGDDRGSHEGHEKHKGHHGSKEDSGEDDGGSHEGHGNKGHPSSKEGSHEDRGKSVCNKLEPSQHGKWIPRQCSKKFQKLGHVCKLECNRGFDRSGGSQVRCMESGWEGEYGVNIIPTCMSGGTTSGDNEQSTESTTRSTVEEISVEFMNIFNYTDGGYEQVLFIVDSSQNVGETTFYRTELNFVKVITEVLFSRISFFGLTTYNGVTDVVIPLDEYQSSGFIQRVDNVRYSPRDGSDMANALDQSFSDIRRSRRRTLVVLISGTESSTDGSGEARLIQTRGNILIPVIVGEANRNTAIAISSVNEEGSSLYFVFQSWESFSSTTVYISENYKRTSGDTSTTHPAGDETSDYRTTSDDMIHSTEDVTSGTVEEISHEFLSILNNTGEGYEQVLFIVDSSQNVGENTFYRTELNFVKVITELLLPKITYFGLTTYNDIAVAVIPLAEYGSSGFILRVDDVQYSPREGSDIANVLDRSFSDIQRTGRRTLVVLISGTESSTDGSGEARLIQSRGNIIIPVIVGEVNRNTATSISSTSEEGRSLYFLFKRWESFSSTIIYISENYKRTSDDTSTTHPAGDETSDYRTTSDDMIHSTEDVTSGTVEEISHEFLSILNNTGEGYEQVLFIVDSSQNVGEDTFYRTELNFVKVITELLLPKITYFGLTTYNDIAVAVIPLAEYGSSGFILRVDDVQYSPREGSDIANVLDRSFSDIQRTGRRTLVVLISGTESSTDGSGEARLIQSRGNIIIPVIVGEVNRNTATSISSTSEEGRSLYFLFKSWESFSSTIIYISESYETTSPGTTGTNPQTTEMISACAALENIDNGHWESSTCSEESSTEGTVCHLVCESGFDLSGDAEVTCTESGWESSDGDNQLPACMTLEERSYELVERLNNSLYNTSNVLIVLDESWSVGQDHFTNVQLAFFNTLLNVISLTKHSIGVITYSDTANVVISLGEYEKSVLQDRMNLISYEQGGVSNIENALEVVTSEIQRSGLTGSTLILLVSTSNSSTDGSSQARRINNNGGVIFPLVVGSDYNRLLHISSVTEREERTFFKFTSWESFSSILSFINENYKSDSTEDFHVCEVLENSQRGHWEASNCSSGTSALGTVCEFVCEEGYELSGTPEVTCNQSGWVSYGGGRSMPSCKTIEEIGEDFIANINRTLGRPANLMFVVDGSGSLTEEQFDLETGLVNAIVRAFPLSEDRSAGVVTFSSDATVDISVSTDDTCTFLSDVSAIKYPRGGTNIAQALQLANNELEQNAVHDFTITFLITDGISTTDPTEPAAVLKRGDNPLFAIGVGDYDAEQLTSIAKYFYPIRDFGIFNSLKNVLETDYASRTNIQC